MSLKFSLRFLALAVFFTGCNHDCVEDVLYIAPVGVATDLTGNVYVADASRSAIFKISPAGVAAVLAGTPGVFGSTDGPADAALFFFPSGVAVGASGNIYVSDQGNHTVRVITPDGAVTTLAGTAGKSGSSDGTGAEARFNTLSGIATDNAGNVFVSDSFDNTIRMITPAGVVTTLAGAPGQFGSADGIGAVARFNRPSGVAVDAAGNVDVSDEGNHAVRMITPAGVVTTLAGAPDRFGSVDGAGAAASFTFPRGVSVNSAGDIYVSDNTTIRKVTAAGDVTTFAGTAFSTGSTDGTGSAARFSAPTGIATDSADNLFVADTQNTEIRKITPGTVVTTFSGSVRQSCPAGPPAPGPGA